MNIYEHLKDNYHIILSIDTNRINVDNGKYQVRFKHNNKNFYSDNEVIVKSNLIDIETLIQASKESHYKSEYWGKFLETIEFDKKDNIIDIQFGS